MHAAAYLAALLALAAAAAAQAAPPLAAPPSADAAGASEAISGPSGTGGGLGMAPILGEHCCALLCYIVHCTGATPTCREPSRRPPLRPRCRLQCAALERGCGARWHSSSAGQAAAAVKQGVLQ